ncbi:MAG TPA: hypothetical protein VGL63_02770 [Streptosporangiaceae bacterium]|jgi:hypothetical protein
MELLRTRRLLLALTDTDNIASQAAAARPGMTDEGVTGRWSGETMLQYRKVIRPITCDE